ncbi:translocation/assembly module TamB domain-containing protein [Pseudoxanthomonas sacheonensis]|uniref:translocation/assembly module TamB domain-containing protein n=1 Tax=Pseudoxanthomonas sacheonensis TaxID=443615 RepID=UPI0013D1E3D3|nr:pathogenicity protein [Pseudoxanthomonas sacheonensis]
MSPQERDARIAELRARRRARMRTLALRSTLVSLALALLLIVALYWLLQTVAGRDVLLNQIITRLPAGSSFTWKKAEGPLAGPLTLYGVDFRYEKIHFTAERVYLDPDLRPLLGKRLRLDALQVTSATLEIPKSDEPFELPTWPELLPQIEMPIAIQADAMAIDGLRITQNTQPLIDIRRAHGGIDIGDGYFKAERLAIDSDRGRIGIHGSYEPRDGYATDVVATAVFPASLGRTPARLGLVARGNRKSMDMGLAGNAPAPVRVTLGVRGEDNPTWSFSGKTESLDLALLGMVEDSMPLAFDLEAKGAGGAAALQGRIAQGDFVAVIEPSKIRIADEVLTVEPLAVRAFDGLTTLRGRADFKDPENPVFKFSANARGLRWGQDAQTQIGADADLGIAGQMKAWAAIGKATLVREKQKATVDFDGRGDGEQLVLKKLQAKMPTGTLDATGTVGWEPALRWDLGAKLAGFDPGYFLADWKGNVSGDLASKGQARETGGFDATLDVPKLGGSLRGRKLDGRGKFALHGDQGEGELALSLGNSRVNAKGKVGDRLDVDAKLQPLHLDDLLPDASGSIAGTLKLTGARNAPNVDADLTGSGLKWSGYSADALSVRGRLPWAGSGGELAVRGSAVDVGMVLDSVRLDAHGAVENLRFDGGANNSMGSVSLAGTALKRGANWQGSLDALQLTPSKGSSWRLQQAARYAQNGSAFTLSPACLAASGGGALCAQANWPKQGIQVHADALPLTLVQPWLPPNNGRPLTLRGEIKLKGSVKPAGNAWVGELHLSSLDGGLKLGNNARGEIVRYDNFTLDVDFNPQTIKGRLGTGFKGDGFVDATIATGWDEFAPLKGDIYFHNSRLFWMELFSPDLVRPTGKLQGHVGLAGTRGTPALSGDAHLTEFKGELPSLGITLTDGIANLDAQADGSARIDGTLKSVSSTGGTVNGGTLSVDGTLDWKVEGSPLQFNIRGKDFLVSDTTELQAVASPDLQVGFANNTIQVRGKVAVPSASIDVEKLDDGVSVSEDVVVLDPADPERTPSSRLDLDMAITLGDAVKLKGYGLDGTLAGTMNVRSRIGREMVATGRLDVDGRYTAYGQKLNITRGELVWSNNAVSDPRINIRAEREVVSAGVTAGIDVTGRAGSPKATIWSNPAMDESAALAYLVLGRSLNTASTDETRKINAASTALSAGAGLLASQLGAKIGLDDAGVLESRTLGGSVFGVGKYLSPKLYVSYGVSMVGGGSAITLKYLLRKGFDVEIESSTVETRGSLNWRKEK